MSEGKKSGDESPQSERMRNFKKRQRGWGQLRYRTTEVWRNTDSDRRVHSTEYDFVGDKTKLFGAAFLRLRQQDFESLEHCEGIPPA